jgi:hypothetical protein
MTNEELHCLNEIIKTLQADIVAIKASETAFRDILAELADIAPPNIAEIILSHPHRRDEILKAWLLNIGDSDPALSDELQKKLPKLPPD